MKCDEGGINMAPKTSNLILDLIDSVCDDYVFVYDMRYGSDKDVWITFGRYILSNHVNVQTLGYIRVKADGTYAIDDNRVCTIGEICDIIKDMQMYTPSTHTYSERIPGYATMLSFYIDLIDFAVERGIRLWFYTMYSYDGNPQVVLNDDKRDVHVWYGPDRITNRLPGKIMETYDAYCHKKMQSSSITDIKDF